MKKNIFYLIFIVTVSLQASSYAVVVHQNSHISKLSKKQIKDIFLKKRHFIKEIQLIPVNIASRLRLRREFETKILKINRAKLNRYWVKKHFQGISPPLTQSSTRSMKLFIKNVKGAIGYLPLTQIDSELKVLYEF